MVDLLVIGGGPAGLSAALYGLWMGLEVLLVAQEMGGTLNEIPILKNYPGFSGRGRELAERMLEQIKEAEIVSDTIRKIQPGFKAVGDFDEYEAKAVILATGSRRRKLKVKGEDLAGVSYCATCDAPFAKGKRVVVVGGGNSAFTEALHLVDFAKEVILIHRRGSFRADPALVEEAKKKGIRFLLEREVVEILGEKAVEGVKLNTGEELPTQMVFVAIGLEPNSHLAEALGARLDEKGYVVVDPNTMQTSVPLLFAAGDVVSLWPKQVISAAAQGSIAALSASKMLRKQ